MGQRTRNSGRISYDVEVSQDEFQKLRARAEELDTTIEEIVRADLLAPGNKDRLVPRARKLVRHATITVRSKGIYADKSELPSGELFLDD